MKLRLGPSGPYLDQGPPLGANEGDVLVSRATAAAPLGEWLPVNPSTLVGTGALANFNTNNNPVALYNFDTAAPLVNLGTVGAPGDLTAAIGAVTFSDIFPGKTAMFFSGAPGGAPTRLQPAAFVPEFAINGDFSAGVMCMFDGGSATTPCVFAHGGNATGLEPDNTLYSMLAPLPTADPPRRVQFTSQHNAGIADNVLTPVNFCVPPVHNLYQFWIVRNGLNVSWFLNGRFVATSAIVAPTGGTGANCRLQLGGSIIQGMRDKFLMYGFKLLDVAYTVNDIVDEYNATMGPVFGNAVVP